MKELIERLWESDEASALTNQAARAIEQLQAGRDELAAQVAALKEAIAGYCEFHECETDAFNAALSLSPPAALDALRAKHLEEAAKVCDGLGDPWVSAGDHIACAEEIRLLFTKS